MSSSRSRRGRPGVGGSTQVFGSRWLSSTPLLAACLFVFALLPRAWARGTFVTVDEAYHWFERAQLFLDALRAGDFAGTNLIGHPGVTTMWLGASGLVAHEFLGASGWLDPADPHLRRLALRLPVAVVASLSIALAFPLLRRLFGRPTALLAALFWAAEPFLVAHGQVLHTDALLSSFMTLSVLAAIVAFQADEGTDREARSSNVPMLLASAVAAGLALLTKAPSVLLAPAILIIAVWSRPRGTRLPARIPVRPLVIWGGVALLTWFVLWPAAWVNIRDAAGNMYRQVRYDGGSPHGWGNFFLGRTVADPGPLFYPVVLLFRLPPWTLAGLAVAATAGLVRWRGLAGRAALGQLASFALLFLLVVSILPKKFDRYALPAFPALEIIAAVALVWLAGRIVHRISSKRGRLSPISNPALAWPIVVAGLALNLAWYHPYEIAYYNPLFGGGRVASRVLPVGWGEGYEQAGAFIAGHHAGCDRPVATWLGPALAPFVCDPVVGMDWAMQPDRPGYAVLYIDQIQRGNAPEATAALLGKATPIHTVTVHGIDYAYIYQVTPPVAYPATAEFGAALQFQGFDADLSQARSNGSAMLRLQWNVREPVPEGLMLFIHLLAPDGTRVGQIDVPLVGQHAPPAAWQRGAIVTWDQSLPLTPGLPAGEYWLALGVYEPETFARLPLRASIPDGAPTDGDNALILGPLAIP